MKAITSARFTYPEFDKTIFSTFEPEQLQEFREGKGWQRDRKNTQDLVAFLESNKEKNTPFFGFMFFLVYITYSLFFFTCGAKCLSFSCLSNGTGSPFSPSGVLNCKIHFHGPKSECVVCMRTTLPQPSP